MLTVARLPHGRDLSETTQEEGEGRGLQQPPSALVFTLTPSVHHGGGGGDKCLPTCHAVLANSGHLDNPVP